MPWPAPLLLLVGPLVPAFIALLLRRWSRVAGGVSALAALVLWRMISTVSLVESSSGLFAGAELPVLGRVLILSPMVQATFSLLYICLAGLLFLTIWWRQGRDYGPTSFLVLALLAGAMMARPFSFGVLFLLAAAAGTTVIIQSDRAGATDAAFRYLAFITLATPLFLVSGWMLDSAQTSLQAVVWGLLLMGAALLLAGFPFLIWVRPLVVTGSSLTPAFVFGLVGLGHLAFLLTLLGENQWVFGVSAFTSLLRASGLLTVLLGGLLALISRLSGNLLGALLLIDLGAAQMWLTLGDAGMAAQAALPRFLALVSAGIGAALMAQAAGQERGSWSHRLGLAAFVYGGLGLVGLPMTPAFWARWKLMLGLAALGEAGSWYAIVLMVSIALALIGLVQFVRSVVRNPGLNVPSLPAPAGEPKPMLLLGLTSVVLFLSLLLALVPQFFWQLTSLAGP